MNKSLRIALILSAFLTLIVTGFVVRAQTLDQYAYLPLVAAYPSPTPTATPTATHTPTPTATPTATPTPDPSETMVEFRGVWVSRFDWTSAISGAQPEKIDEIVDNVADAGFNVIFFQVRGEADAFYTPGLEPWSQRMTGRGNDGAQWDGLGVDPGWDPLQRMIDRAHSRGVEVHAYLNIYPVVLGCSGPPDTVTPRHLYHQIIDQHGVSGGSPSGLQWTESGTVHCSGGEYQRVTPASVFFDNHLIGYTAENGQFVPGVAADLVQRYDIDGIHLDHIRYAAGGSFDPVSQAAFAVDETGLGYDDWQRRQVNGTVAKFYERILPLKEGLWLSAAVWPIHTNHWGWPTSSEGYNRYYQDSKAWVQGGYIDSISPMIYPAQFGCPDTGFWTIERWETLVRDFQADSGGRYVIPGIGTGYCTFDEIENRIDLAREIGTVGHALFSYRSLVTFDYFDDLANGPYLQPAVVPDVPWHN